MMLKAYGANDKNAQGLLFPLTVTTALSVGILSRPVVVVVGEEGGRAGQK